LTPPAHRTPYHDFTLDELEAYDRGVLEPARVAVIEEHLAEGCPACRRWLAGSDEAVRLIEELARAESRRPRPTTPWGHARAWGRRRVHARRLTVLLYALPLKGALVAAVLRADARRGVRVSAAVGIVGLTVVVGRAVLAPPDR
jgi:predicted anti-sigma-YlaC factor YlaD